MMQRYDEYNLHLAFAQQLVELVAKEQVVDLKDPDVRAGIEAASVEPFVGPPVHPLGPVREVVQDALRAAEGAPYFRYLGDYRSSGA